MYSSATNQRKTYIRTIIAQSKATASYEWTHALWQLSIISVSQTQFSHILYVITRAMLTTHSASGVASSEKPCFYTELGPWHMTQVLRPSFWYQNLGGVPWALATLSSEARHSLKTLLCVSWRKSCLQLSISCSTHIDQFIKLKWILQMRSF